MYNVRFADELPENFKVKCSNCDTYITKYGSCDCGVTSQDLIESQINSDETDQRYN